MGEFTRMADVPDGETVTGQTVIYTAGCINGTSGRKFVNCKIVFPTVEDRAAFCEEIMESAPDMDVSVLPADMQQYIRNRRVVENYYQTAHQEQSQ